MIALLLGLIIFILLLGPFGLGLFTGIMIYILPIYLICSILKIIIGHKKKCPKEDKRYRGKG